MEEKKPLRNFGLITPSEYVGKTYQEARQYAIDGGFTTRIVEENGVSYMLTMDVKGDRLNFRIKNDIVIDVYGG
jgi:hypothetical protein